MFKFRNERYWNLCRKLNAGSRRLTPFKPRFEPLEDRLALAHFQILETPEVNRSGDAFVGQEDTKAAGNWASYDIFVTAGQGPRYPQIPEAARWEYSNGQFTVQGAYTVTIQPDENEQIGDRVRVVLGAGYTVTGGTGAGVYKGHTDTGYRVEVRAYSPDGAPVGSSGQGTLFRGQRSARLINESPTGQITDFHESRHVNRTIEAKIGDTISISTELFGSAATWQGGFTGVARGAVTGSVSYELSVERYSPDINIAIAQNTEARTLDVQYAFDTWGSDPAPRDATLDLYWVDTSGVRRGSAFYSTKLPISSFTDGTISIPVSMIEGKLPGVWADQIEFVAADPDNPSKSFGESLNANNFGKIPIFAEPTVELEFEPAIEDPDLGISVLYEKQPYRVYATIQNNSLVRSDFEIDLAAKNLGPVPPGLQETQVFSGLDATNVPALGTSGRILVATATHDWDWIPDENPMSSDRLIGYTFPTGWEPENWGALVDTLLSKVPGIFGSGYKIVSFLKDTALPLADYANQTEDGQLIATHEQMAVQYTATVTSTLTSSVEEVEGVYVRVPQMRRVQFEIFLAKRMLADMSIQLGIGEVASGKVELGTKLISGGLAAFEIARIAYDQAKDPPDPNFTEIAEPQPLELSVIAEEPTDLSVGLTRAMLDVRALQKAQAISRDRADGAREAGAYSWEATQTEMSAKYAAQAAVQLVTIGIAEKLLIPFREASDPPVSEDIRDYLAENGLPPEVRSVLDDFGISQADQDQLLLDALAMEYSPGKPTQDYALAILDLTRTASVAMEELESAVRVRTLQLGQEVAEVPLEEYWRLDELRYDLESALNEHATSQYTLRDIGDYLTAVQDLILETNNLEDLREHLDFAYTALFRIQTADWSLAGLRSALDTYQTDELIPPDAAAEFDDALRVAEIAIKEGRFADAKTSLDNALGDMLNRWASVMPSHVVLRLADSITGIQSVVSGSFQTLMPTAVPDAIGIDDPAPLSIDVLANDVASHSGQLRLLAVTPPLYGTATIDDGGTPSDLSDDKVVYTPGPFFVGTDSFAYYVIGSQGEGVATGEVNIFQKLVVGQEYSQAIPQGDYRTFSFEADKGTWYQLETLEVSGYLDAEIVGPDGDWVTYGAAWPGEPIWFRADSAGQYQVQFYSYYGGADVRFQLSELPQVELEPGHDYVAASTSNSVQIYSFQADAGGWYQFNLLEPEYAEAMADVFDSGGELVFAGRIWTDSPVRFAASASGPYTVILTDVETYDPDVGASVRIDQLDDVPLIELGLPVAGALNPAGGDSEVVEELYLIPITAGESLRVALPETSHSAVYAEVYGPNNNRLGGTSYSKREFVIDSETDGALLLVIYGSYFTEAAEYEFIVQPVVTQQAPIILGDAVVGTLAGTGDRHIYTFSGVAGTQVLFDWSSSGWASVNLRLPNGQERSATGLQTLPEDGEYELELISQDGSVDYRFRLHDPASWPLVAVGDEMSGEFERPVESLEPEQVVFRLSLEEGQRLVLDATATPLSEYFYGSVRLFLPSGELIDATDFTQSLLFTAPSSGEYYFVLQGSEEAAFSARVTTQPEPLTLELPLGEIVEGAIDRPGRTVTYTFAGSAGQLLYYESLDKDFDQIVVRLRGPEGRTLVFSNADLDGMMFLPVSGDYELEFQGQDAVVGDLRFRLSQLSSADLLQVGDTASGTIAPRTAVVYAFDGAANQQLLFDSRFVSENEGGGWILYGPNGWNLNKHNDPLTSSFHVTLPTTGRYHLALKGWSENDVAYEFQISEPQTTFHPLTFGAVTAGELTEPGERHIHAFSGHANQVLFFDSVGATNEFLILRLVGPDGQVVASFNGNVDGPAFVLPVEGEYQLSVVTADALPADYLFRLVDVSAQASLPFEEPISGVVPWVVGEPAGSASDVYLLTVEGATRLRLQFESFENDSPYITWTVYDPVTSSVLETSWIDRDWVVTLPAAGNYVLVFSDGPQGESAEFQFQVNPTPNSPPQIIVEDSQFTNERELLRFFVYAYDPDYGQLLTYSLIDAPVGATIDPATGEFRWTPGEAQGPGTFTFAVRVTDNGNPPLFSEQTVTVTVFEQNVAPVLEAIGSRTITVLETLSFQVRATDSDLPANTLSYSISDLPPGATFDIATGTFEWAPTPARAPGTYSVTFSVSDGEESVSETIEIVISEGSSNPWHNALNPLDVDGIEGITPLDVLIVINELNLMVLADPATGLLPSSAGSVPVYLDVDNDGYVTPLDALIIINYLNTNLGQLSSEGEGEGESNAIPASVTPALLDLVIESHSDSLPEQEADWLWLVANDIAEERMKIRRKLAMQFSALYMSSSSVDGILSKELD